MDLSYAIWLYNPSAEYVLSHSNATNYEDILEWRGPGPMPTEQQLQNLWDGHDKEERLTVEERVLYLEEKLTLLEDEVTILKEAQPKSPVNL